MNSYELTNMPSPPLGARASGAARRNARDSETLREVLVRVPVLEVGADVGAISHHMANAACQQAPRVYLLAPRDPSLASSASARSPAM